MATCNISLFFSFKNSIWVQWVVIVMCVCVFTYCILRERFAFTVLFYCLTCISIVAIQLPPAHSSSSTSDSRATYERAVPQIIALTEAEVMEAVTVYAKEECCYGAPDKLKIVE